MKRSRLELLKNALKALPVCTTMSGAVLGYLERHEVGHTLLMTMSKVTMKQPADPLLWHEILQNVAIVSAMGLTSGMALTCFGLAALHHVSVEEDSPDRQARHMSIGTFIPTRFKTYFKKKHVEEHEKTTQKATAKYDKKRQEEKAETKEILEIGTEGVRAKKFGKKASNQNPGNPPRRK